MPATIFRLTIDDEQRPWSNWRDGIWRIKIRCQARSNSIPDLFRRKKDRSYFKIFQAAVVLSDYWWVMNEYNKNTNNSVGGGN